MFPISDQIPEIVILSPLSSTSPVIDPSSSFSPENLLSLLQRLENLRFTLIIPVIFIAANLQAQIKNVGTPQIKNYPKAVYNAGTQNWGITQDKNGFMYFANNEGILMFDGLNWHLIEVSRSKPVRSVFTGSDNRIYLGLLNDFGYLEPSDSNLYVFKSLRSILPESTGDFDEIWKIYEIPEGMIFQAYEYLFLVKNEGGVEILEPEGRFEFSFYANNRLFIHEAGRGLFEYRMGALIYQNWSEPIKNREIWDIVEYRDNEFLICTSGGGIFHFDGIRLSVWNVPVNELLQEYKLYSVQKLDNDHLAFGTILNGLIITGPDGNILQHINRNNGLQNNTVLSLYRDNSKNLWVGLDNGIDYLEINSPFSYFTGNEGLGTGYCARIFNGKVYLGTNQGLFVKNISENQRYYNENFRLVENTTGQVWSLGVFKDQLICGHNSGTYLIKDETAVKISDEEGAWKYIQLKTHPDLLLGGHYTGLNLLKYENGTFTFLKKIKGFRESSRFIEEDKDGGIWVSHGSKGVYRISLNPDLDSVRNFTLYGPETGLPSTEQNIVFNFGEDILVSTVNGIYKFDFNTQEFTPSERYRNIFNTKGRLKTFEIDQSGNIWFIAQGETGVLILNADSTYTRIDRPFNTLVNNVVNEFEFIHAHSSQQVFIGIDNGFAHYTMDFPKSYSENYPSYIMKVNLPYLDSTLNYPSLILSESEYLFPFSRNSIRFHYSAPYFEANDQLEFSYYLKGYSEEWSPWSPINFKDFTNLWEGEYTFMLKAKNVYDVESEISTFTFQITPPMHRTRFALIVYIFILVLFALLVFRMVRIRERKAKERDRIRHKNELQMREEQFQRQSLISEKEIIRLRNDKLRADMIYRDKELANQTMNIIQKNKLLSKLKDELNNMQRVTEDEGLKSRMVVLKRHIDKELDNEQQSQVFKTYFEEVHEKFFERLKEKHPDLSSRELHLSAYIRMNLTSKEIATLQNITSRGVEIGRYRLRKKLNLSREINLSTYLTNL